jgi:hypothetical protein
VRKRQKNVLQKWWMRRDIFFKIKTNDIFVGFYARYNLQTAFYRLNRDESNSINRMSLSQALVEQNCKFVLQK